MAIEIKEKGAAQKSAWIEAKAQELNEYVRDYKTALEMATKAWNLRDLVPLKKPLKK